MTFEEMLKALMNGKKIRKKAWDIGIYRMLGDGKYIIDQEGNESAILIDGSFDADVWEEYKEDILDEKEKEYLRAVINPFRDRITYIAKVEEDIHWFYWIMIRVDIGFLNDYYDFCLPPFEETSDMYKKMEVGKEYTLKELGL